MSSPRNVLQQVGVLKTIINRSRLVWRLMRDPRVPIYLKAIPVVAAGCLISPLEFIPVLGQLDEIGIILIGTETFIALCPRLVVAEHMAAIERDAPYAAGASSSETIEGEWRTK